MCTSAIAVATGHLQHRFVPEYIRALPASRWAHSADSYLVEKVAKRRIVVIGGGLSAIEIAVLLSEAGSDVSVISRRDRTSAMVPYYGGLVADWLERSRQNPEWWMSLDTEAKGRIIAMIEDYNPMTAWLASRVTNLQLLIEEEVSRIQPTVGSVLVQLHSGRSVECEYVVAATGFRPLVSNLDFLLKVRDEVGIATTEGAPWVDRNCLSSIPGLYFCGLLASPSLGPVMRLIAGTAVASPAITGSLLSQQP